MVHKQKNVEAESETKKVITSNVFTDRMDSADLAKKIGNNKVVLLKASMVFADTLKYYLDQGLFVYCGDKFMPLSNSVFLLEYETGVIYRISYVAESIGGSANKESTIYVDRIALSECSGGVNDKWEEVSNEVVGTLIM